MNVGKLKRVAIKEFKRSPAKTGFLLLMLPVALYFCVPLLVGMLRKPSPSTSATTVGEVSKNASFVAPAATQEVETSSQTEQGWVEFATSLDNDLLAVPANIPANVRNPFAAIKPEKKEPPLAATQDGGSVEGAETETKSAEYVERPIVTSEVIRAMGFRLTATMIGQRSKHATINGKTYAEGEAITLNDESDMAADTRTTVPVTLAHVDRRFVVLKMDGHEHRLQLPNELPRNAIVVKSRPE